MDKKPYYKAIVRLNTGYILVFSIIISQGCGTLVHHKVERGDSLYSIGFYYGQDYRDIAQWNSIPAPYALYPGQWLRVTPPEMEWWEGQKRHHNNNKPFISDNNKNKKILARAESSNRSKNVSVKSRSVQTERLSDLNSDNFSDSDKLIRHWIWPSKGELLNPRRKFSERNKGIDIGGKQGQPIRASAAGKVVYSGSGLIGYGRLIIIKHNKTYLSAYAHNEQVLVKEGDVVKQSQQIAKMGRTPEQHTLLHFEIRKNGKPVDPLRLLAR